MDVERTTTVVQGVGLLVGGALALAGAFVAQPVGGLTLSALGVGIVGVGFAVAAVGSYLAAAEAAGTIAADKRVQAGLQGLAAAGFLVLFVGLAADLGVVVVLLGGALVLASIFSRSYLERRN